METMMDRFPTSPSSPDNSRLDPRAIHVDEEGDWFYQGNKIIREDILEFFLENLRLAPDGAFMIEWKQQRCYLDASDTPFVISGVDRGKPDGSRQSGSPSAFEGFGEERILLTLRHLSTAEVLNPATLYVGKENVLYCRVRGGRFPARFSRPAYYRFASWIQEDTTTGEFYVELDGKRYHIAMP